MSDALLLTYLAFAVPAGFSIVLIGYNMVRESLYVRFLERQKERDAIIEIIKSYKPNAADPDIREFRQYILSRVENRK